MKSDDTGSLNFQTSWKYVKPGSKNETISPSDTKENRPGFLKLVYEYKPKFDHLWFSLNRHSIPQQWAKCE